MIFPIQIPPPNLPSFNHLMLPAYSSLEVTRAKLLFAIRHSEGFMLR